MNVEFNEENNQATDVYYSRSVLSEQKVPKMLSWLQNKNIVSTPEQGRKVLVSVTVVCFLLSFILFVRLLWPESVDTAPTDQVFLGEEDI